MMARIRNIVDYVLGFSATPVRPKKDIEVAKVFGNGKVVYFLENMGML
jgi:hypothetical protein